MRCVESIGELQQGLTQGPISLVYFGSESCDVCLATRPKVEDVLRHYPAVEAFYCPGDRYPELFGQHLVFTVPAVLVFHHGREVFRNARFIDVMHLKKVIGDLVDDL